MAITFNGDSKLISLDSDYLDLSILWSSWVNWILTSDNSKYPIAFTQVGGDTINLTDGTFIPLYYFLQNGWKIKPREANHTLSVSNGILLVDGGGDPFVNTIGEFVVRVNYQQPVQSITVATGGGSSYTLDQIANAVWNKMIDTMTVDYSIGEFVTNALGRQDSLVAINDGVKKASRLIPYTTNL